MLLAGMTDIKHYYFKYSIDDISGLFEPQYFVLARMARRTRKGGMAKAWHGSSRKSSPQWMLLPDFKDTSCSALPPSLPPSRTT